MKIGKYTLFLFMSFIFLSIVIANFISIINIEAQKISKLSLKKFNIDDKDEYLIWFIQISDIHLSIFRDSTRISEFKEFCDQTVGSIRPRVVLATGDLTDAKTADGIGSKQFKEEWVFYNSILRECLLMRKTAWLDIRGNHDNFNVAGPDSEQNYFTNFSVQGRKHPRSYSYKVKNPKSGEIYHFLGIDACLEPGPRRPFNFIGLLDQLEIDEINKLMIEKEESGNNFTVWFGHFPTSCILSTGNENVRDLIGKDPNGLVYVCGHLHQLAGAVPKMYTLQKNGYLELEVSDWKDNRYYRLMAIDHGFLSFIDIKHGHWPVVLITNPKDALFLNPSRENIDNIRNSKYIRVLAFSLSEIMSVTVRIDGGEWKHLRRVSHTELYVTSWNPELYLNGLHYIEVRAVDEQGRERIQRQHFQVEKSRLLSFDIIPRIVLMTDARTVFRALFLLSILISIFPLLIPRFMHIMVKQQKILKPKYRKTCYRRWLRRFWILSSVDRIFWPLVLYPIYLSFGPWCIGYLIEDYIGVIFAWGIFVNNAFLPGSFTYMYGFIQLVTFHIPLTLMLANAIDNRFEYTVLYPFREKTICSYFIIHLPFILMFTVQVLMAYMFWLAYGFVAFILGPLRTWSLILALVLWCQILCLPDKCFKKAKEIWALENGTTGDVAKDS